jgi:hypothetical protein
MKQFLLPIFALFFLLVGCNNYNKISYSKATVFKKKPVAEKIDDYDVYVHQNDKTYKLSEPVIAEEVLTGIPVEVTVEEAPEDENLNDMHIHLNNDSEVDLTQTQTQKFDDSNVKEVEMYGKAREGLTGGTIALLIVFGLLAVLLIIILIAVFSAASSGGSDSGGSDSGTSDSGTSDSGGSDIGCYIATMSYGSYDAPQVLILREFRDRFLDRFKAGRSFIAWYYRTSPTFVEKHRSKKWLHTTLRVPLNVFVAFLRIFYTGKHAAK